MRVTSHSELDKVVIEGLSRDTAASGKGDLFAAPFAEGGKARAIVELCATLHLPALFIDPQGLAFRASAEAADYIERDVFVREGRVLLRSERATALLEEAVSRAICALDAVPGQRSLKLPGSIPLYATVLDYPNRSEFQLLKAIVVLGRVAGEHREEIATLVRRLASA